MRLSRALSAAALLVAAAALPTYASSPSVGEMAPDFGEPKWILNAPDETSMEAFKGEVVFIDEWGVKCGPCLALIPHVQKLQEEFGDKGLHIFAFEVQGSAEDVARDTAKSRGAKTYPVAMGGPSGYSNSTGGIPHGWLVGVEGKVIWEGNPGDGKMDQILRAEMAKVKFPGLGKVAFDKGVNPILSKFMKRDYAGARIEAQKMIEGAKASEAVAADAEHISKRITSIGEKKLAAAKAREGEKRYGAAAEIYGFLAGAYKGAEEGKAASDRLKEMKADKEIQREMQAAEALKGLVASLERKPAEEKKAALESFAKAKKFEGTQAAADAQAMTQ